MNKKNFLLLGILVITGCLFVSCSSRKNFVYLQDLQHGERFLSDTKHEAVIQRDDRLSIVVSAKSPELALPFNMQGAFRITEDGNISSENTSSGVKEKGYRVDVNGDIDFPILGKLHLEGLTLNEATALIKNGIMERDYIKDPLVAIEFLNFKYVVLGAVGRTGTFSVEGDRVTLLEAIANAGDLTSKARVDRIAVIREIGDERQMFMHDLRSKDFFTSPCFYLQQNDIVYVEPKYAKKDGEERGLQYTTLLLSILGSAASILWLILRK